mgnify:CR=1 FL=1
MSAIRTFTVTVANPGSGNKYYIDGDKITKKVKSSKKLMSVLESVLRIGNLMNQGTHAGGASGFKLNSLMFLDTRWLESFPLEVDYLRR